MTACIPLQVAGSAPEPRGASAVGSQRCAARPVQLSPAQQGGLPAPAGAAVTGRQLQCGCEAAAHPPFLGVPVTRDPVHYISQPVDSLPSNAQHGQALGIKVTQGRGSFDVDTLPTTWSRSSARRPAYQQH